MSCAPIARRTWVFGIAGAALLAGLSQRYRIDLVKCGVWPSLPSNVASAIGYWLALALLSIGWLRLLRACESATAPRFRSLLIYGGLVHGIALCAMPFLSDDSLFYAATSRLLTVFGGNPYQPYCRSLPAHDPFLTILIDHWQCGTSAYFPGFHLVARLVGALSGESLWLHLKLYQGIAAICIFLSGLLVAAALRRGPQAPAYGFVAVVCNPLSIIEGTVNAHNDALLALGCALFLWCLTRKSTLGALASLAVSVAIKASALLLVAMYGTQLVMSMLTARARRLADALPWLMGFSLIVGVAALAILRRHAPTLQFTAVLGSPSDPWEYCTRSIECIPRAIFRWVLHMNTAAWITGLCFRVLGGLWLLSIARSAFRAGTDLLGWLAYGLLVYYLYLHGWSQTWYLLSMVPLLPWAFPRARPAMIVASISGCAYYALVLLASCNRTETMIAIVDFLEALIVIVPPTTALFAARRGAVHASANRSSLPS